MPRHENDALDKFLQEQQESNYIHPSKSPYATPLFFIGKKDGDLQPVQDYRDLNSYTIKNNHPLPLISELIDRVAKALLFSKVDIRKGFNNIQIKEGDKWKAAFKTNRGLFKPTVMFFGLTNSPSTFQSMMDTIFKDLILSREVVIYMDNILIATPDNLTHHRQLVHHVLDRLEEHDLYLKPKKCVFEVREVEFLGVILGHGQVCMDPVKVQGVLDWPIPQNLKDVCSFLRFYSFYQWFLKGFCHEPRYWSATDRYRATLLQGKQVQDASLWFPYRFRAERSAGNSRGHSLVQSPECGNEFNQAWESCTTTG